MEITIRKPLGYSQIGRKDQQEDAVWPLFSDVTESNHCIVLCDGVGGSEHGEVASQTSSKVIGEYLSEVIAKSNYVCDEDVQDAVNMAYDKLEELDTDMSDGGTVSMATTLTCVCFHTDGILAAHMGDSRIYHVRPGQGLLYQSSDHSLVNALLQAGELTVEEAKVFPRKNVITKAIQPHGNKRFKAEVHQLTDVKSGDYIFLCCDGVLEQLTNERLVEILSLSCSDEEKIQLLEAESTGKTKDNYTAYLIPIDNVEGMSSITNTEEEIAVDVEVEVSAAEETEISASEQSEEHIYENTKSNIVAKKKNMRLYYLTAALLLVCIGFLMIYFGGLITSEDNSNASIENVDSIKQNNLDSLIQELKDNTNK